MDRGLEVVNRNIILTGFMGTGKTTIGKRVASRLGWEFVDTDAFIVRQHGSVAAIFSAHGEEHFRQLESAAVGELARGHRQVIATGGGTMLNPHNAAVLNATGRTLCLVASSETIMRRLGPDAGKRRPLLAGPDPHGAVRRLLADRARVYAGFPQISTETSTMANIADQVVELMRRPPQHIRGPNRSDWWVGVGILGSAPTLGNFGQSPIAVVNEASAHLAPAAGATRALVIGGDKPLDELRLALRNLERDSVVVAIGDASVLSLGVMAAESVGLPVVACPTDLEVSAPCQCVVVDVASRQSGDVHHVEPLGELWDQVASRVSALS